MTVGMRTCTRGRTRDGWNQQTASLELAGVLGPRWDRPRPVMRAEGLLGLEGLLPRSRRDRVRLLGEKGSKRRRVEEAKRRSGEDKKRRLDAWPIPPPPTPPLPTPPTLDPSELRRARSVQSATDTTTTTTTSTLTTAPHCFTPCTQPSPAHTSHVLVPVKQDKRSQ